ncbi:MAG: hypothetical protein H8E16_00960 [Flavobacteriales bacterium]|nr:hypothetical protein [Flavobacteriales bacterium]
MTAKEKAEALYNKFYRIVDRSNPLEDMDKTTKQLCNLFVTETLTSFVINLTDYQTEFWIEVQKEIEKL